MSRFYNSHLDYNNTNSTNFIISNHFKSQSRNELELLWNIYNKKQSFQVLLLKFN